MITIVIPGRPVGHGRPRFSRFSGRCALEVPRAITPLRTRVWRQKAQGFYLVAIQRAGYARPAFQAPGRLELVVRAVYPDGNVSDLDNIAKAVMDAGNGILWSDDRQVARLVVERGQTLAFGSAGHVEVSVGPWSGGGRGV